MAASPKIKQFFQAGMLLRYRKGEVILHADEEIDGIYLIEKGFVKVYSIRNSGEENMHVIYKAGELFPVLYALGKPQLNVFYEALDDVEVRRVSKKDFADFLARDKDMADYLVDYLGTAFWIYANRVENLELARARDRVIFRLLFMMERFGKKNHLEEVILEVPITQQDLADSVKMIRETASREIEKLEQEGLITYRNHRIVILHPDKLREELAKTS